MKLFFISGVEVGGAARSTLELGRALSAVGHDVQVVLADGRGWSGWRSGLWKANVKSREWVGRPVLRPALSLLGGTRGRGLATSASELRVLRPEASMGRLLKNFSADFVIANSFNREAMLWIADEAQRHGIPFVLYLREEHSLSHFKLSALRPDLVIANSHHLVRQVELMGIDCLFVPSLTDLNGSKVESARTCLTLVNPVEENRPQILMRVAEARPDIPCVFQESWPLTATEADQLRHWCEKFPNLTLRTRTAHAWHIYEDCRILIATYPSGRPRVVAEAQRNGLPVIGVDQPALAEAIGPGGLLVDAAIDDAEWASLLGEYWDDAEWYEATSMMARKHAQRSELDPLWVVESFESALEGMSE